MSKFTLCELRAFITDYLETQDDEEKEEWYMTERGIASETLNMFFLYAEKLLNGERGPKSFYVDAREYKRLIRARDENAILREKLNLKVE